MKKNLFTYIVTLICFLVTLCGFLYVLKMRLDQSDLDAVYARMAMEEAEAAAQAEAEAAAQAELAAQEADPEPTPSPEPTPTPEPEYFTLSIIGDLTLANRPNNSSYTNKVGDDYSYPLENVSQYLLNDEYTIGNLECTFSDRNLAYDYTQLFYFKAPSAYANILTEGGVDFVTTANNHTKDYYEKGQDDTRAALEALNIPYGTENQAQIVETPNGIRLGIVCSGDHMRPDQNKDKILEGIRSLKSEGADYVICCFHWGLELYYTPHETNQVKFGHECIDAGADLIYGTHTHCLQPIEKYNGGIILYSMGNFSFGGSDMPSDPDTAIVQITLKRDPDGTVSADGIDSIPCCVSSTPPANLNNVKAYAYNDYKPTPYEEGSEDYYRVLSKLDGTFEPGKQGADYSSYYASLSTE